MPRVRALVLLALALAGCDGSKPLIKNEPDKPGPFPAADRPVAHIVSSRWSNEDARDRLREADTVMNRANIRPGMTVADIGAGEGYYTVRLAARVGAEGRVLAEDIMADTRDSLAERVARERLDNVSVRLGEPADPTVAVLRTWRVAKLAELLSVPPVHSKDSVTVMSVLDEGWSMMPPSRVKEPVVKPPERVTRPV